MNPNVWYKQLHLNSHGMKISQKGDYLYLVLKLENSRVVIPVTNSENISSWEKIGLCFLYLIIALELSFHLDV